MFSMLFVFRSCDSESTSQRSGRKLSLSGLAALKGFTDNFMIPTCIRRRRLVTYPSLRFVETGRCRRVVDAIEQFCERNRECARGKPNRKGVGALGIKMQENALASLASNPCRMSNPPHVLRSLYSAGDTCFSPQNSTYNLFYYCI